jgi:hypothetical protein
MPTRNAKLIVFACLAFAATSAWLAFLTWTGDFSLNGRGLWSALSDLLNSTFGPRTSAVIWVALSFFSMAAARLIWRHTPKLPSDRLLG